MNHEALPLPMKFSLLANRVLLVLRTAEARKPSEAEQRIAGEALEFLDTVEHGRYLVENRAFDARAVEASSAYRVALDVAPKTGKAPELPDVLKNRWALEQLARGEQCSDAAALAKIRDFFKGVRQLSLAQLGAATAIERVTVVR